MWTSVILPYKHPADCMSIKVRPHGQTCPKIFELHLNICLIHSRFQKQDMAACHRNRAVQPHQQLSAWEWGRAKASRQTKENCSLFLIPSSNLLCAQSNFWRSVIACNAETTPIRLLLSDTSSFAHATAARLLSFSIIVPFVHQTRQTLQGMDITAPMRRAQPRSCHQLLDPGNHLSQTF